MGVQSPNLFRADYNMLLSELEDILSVLIDCTKPSQIVFAVLSVNAANVTNTIVTSKNRQENR